ncbi:family 16 glycosylhydrolase [Botrimarina colliarenosi]|uniref:family 16 glycosylhydrolase n=1 Tax=Botrimarina colliarenosi TaxID=2528001 RepID=UPI0018D456B0|nr:family 16 glycosylhydrolase [Botrimarina colliarenosi]
MIRSAFLLALIGLSPVQSIAADSPGWDLVWSDDFDTIDTQRWERVFSTQPTNNSLQAYLPNQLAAVDGNLVITATDTPYQNLPYRSGQVISKAEQRYGRWEVRADLPTSQGNWPAIWLLPDVSKVNWPSGGEIDIMENRGNQPTLTSSAFHYGTNPPYQHNFVYDEQRTSNVGQIVDFHSGFHTYAVDWTPDYLRFYVDGVNYYTVHDADVGGFLSQNTQPMQLVINNAIGGDFLPNPDATSVWPQQMLIDWVRVYEASEGPAQYEFVNGGFEDNGGTLAGWSVFGNDLLDNPNVSTSGVETLGGAAALKVFGPYNGTSYAGVTQGITVEGGASVTASLSAMVRSADPLLGGNEAFLKIEFYDAFGAKYGTQQLLDEQQVVIANNQTATDAWQTQQLEAVAPEGAVEARLAIVFHQPARDAGSVYLDGVAFGVTPTVAQGDFNGDGVVDAADYTVWRDTNNATGPALAADANGDGRVDALDLERWREGYGAKAPGAASSASVPEPSSAVAVMISGLTLAGSRGIAPARTPAAR